MALFGRGKKKREKELKEFKHKATVMVTDCYRGWHKESSTAKKEVQDIDILLSNFRNVETRLAAFWDNPSEDQLDFVFNTLIGVQREPSFVLRESHKIEHLAEGLERRYEFFLKYVEKMKQELYGKSYYKKRK